MQARATLLWERLDAALQRLNRSGGIDALSFDQVAGLNQQVAELGHLDLPPTRRTKLKLVKSVNHQKNDGHEEEQIHLGTDHWLPQAGRGRYAD